MSLEIKTKHIIENFDKVSSREFLEVLNQIKETFQSQITKEYLEGKLDAVSKISDENGKKDFCKNLKPYLDWYLQGKHL